MGHALSLPSEADIFFEVIGQPQGEMSAELARYVLGLELPARLVERLHDLAEKNRDGTLTDDERMEMERYMRVGHFLGLMKSRARLSLREASRANP
jgi:hypothetical protein